MACPPFRTSARSSEERLHLLVRPRLDGMSRAIGRSDTERLLDGDSREQARLCPGQVLAGDQLERRAIRAPQDERPALRTESLQGLVEEGGADILGTRGPRERRCQTMQPLRARVHGRRRIRLRDRRRRGRRTPARRPRPAPRRRRRRHRRDPRSALPARSRSQLAALIWPMQEADRPQKSRER